MLPQLFESSQSRHQSLGDDPCLTTIWQKPNETLSYIILAEHSHISNPRKLWQGVNDCCWFKLLNPRRSLTWQQGTNATSSLSREPGWAHLDLENCELVNGCCFKLLNPRWSLTRQQETNATSTCDRTFTSDRFRFQILLLLLLLFPLSYKWKSAS